MNDNKDNKLQNVKKPSFVSGNDIKLNKPLDYYKSKYGGILNRFPSKLLNRKNIQVATDYLKVEGNQLLNEMARVTSKGTSSFSSGTFSHNLAKGYMDSYNGYYIQKQTRNNLNLDLARQFHNKEIQGMMRKFNSMRK